MKSPFKIRHEKHKKCPQRAVLKERQLLLLADTGTDDDHRERTE